MDTKKDSRIERKKEETKNKIISMAVELFNRFGLEAATMEQIGEAADVAKGTLYNYFPSKEAIINAYLQRTFRERNDDRLTLLRQLPNTRARMTRIFSLLIEGVQAQKQIFEVFWIYRMKQVISFKPLEAEQTGLSFLIHEIITLGQQSRELRSDLPEDILSGLFEFALIEAIKPLYLTPENFDPSRSIELCVDVFLNGARAL